VVLMSSVIELTAADVPRIAALEADCFPPGSRWTEDQYAEQFAVPGTGGFGFVEYGRLVAAVLYTPGDEDGLTYVLSVAVGPGHRRRGLATLLVNRVLRRGGPVALHCRLGNEEALRLYRGLGFAPVRTEAGYYEDGEDAALLLRP
jgi:ribosomal protein S18 acetylase RimI-like enzyme